MAASGWRCVRRRAMAIISPIAYTERAPRLLERLSACRLHTGAVAEVRVPITASLWRQVQDVVDRAQKIEAALSDVVGHRGMRRVEMAKRAIAVPRENRYCRILIPLAVFAAEVVLECIATATQEPQSVPPTASRVRTQGRRIGGGNDGNVDVLSEV